MAFSCPVTLVVRRVLLSLLLIPALIGGGGAGVVWTLWSRGVIADSAATPVHTAAWYGSVRLAVDSDLLWAMAGISFLVALAIIGEVVLRRVFGRSSSPEIFFLRVFLLTLPLQAGRLLIPLVWSGWLPNSWGIVVTRVAWFGRFVGLASLLNASLFTSDIIPFRRSGSVLGMGVLASLGIAVIMPLDLTQPMGNLLYRSGSWTALSLSCLSLEFLAGLSLAGQAIVQKNTRYFVLAAFMAGVILGGDMVFFATKPLVLIGGILLTAGTVGFSWEIRKIYQWI